MGITKRDLDKAYAEHKAQYGGSKEDYFALLYLMREFDKSVDQVAGHIAFGEDVAEGINAFHVDVNRRNLYLFQFQWSAHHQEFKDQLRRLAREELDRTVALKLLRADASTESRERRLREARTMAQVSDPNVVTVFDVVRDHRRCRVVALIR